MMSTQSDLHKTPTEMQAPHVSFEGKPQSSLRSLHIWQTMATAEDPWPHFCTSFNTEMPLFFNHAVEPDFPTLSLMRGCSQV